MDPDSGSARFRPALSRLVPGRAAMFWRRGSIVTSHPGRYFLMPPFVSAICRWLAAIDLSRDETVPIGTNKDETATNYELGIREFVNIKTVWIGPATGPTQTLPGME